MRSLPPIRLSPHPLHFPLQGAIHYLLRELRAASSPVGPAPQRLAHYFANALASRVLGDGAQRYAAEVPQNAQVNAQ